MVDRSRDWMEQAEDNLETAAVMRNGGFHNVACFIAQQAAMCATTAADLSQLRGGYGRIPDLLHRLGADEALMVKGRALDVHYNATRYPYAHVSGAPFEHYGSKESEEAIEYARNIIQFARSHMAQPC